MKMKKTPQQLHANVSEAPLSDEECCELRKHAEAIAETYFKVPESPEPFLTEDMFKVLEANNLTAESHLPVRRQKLR
jgi:hypothetical protein